MENFLNQANSKNDNGTSSPVLDAPRLPSSEGGQVYLLPTLATRVMAIFVDLIIILFLSALLAVLIDLFSIQVNPFVNGVAAIMIFLLYDPILTSQSGGTFGHKLLGLRVKRNLSRSENITFLNAILRAMVKGLLGWIVLLTVTMSKEKRGIHDMLSGSIVIRKVL